MATSRSSIVQSGAVARSQLRRPCARAFHWTVAPFVVLYASVVGCYVSAAFEAHGEWLLLALPAILMAQLLAFLACQWSVKFKALATTSSCGIDAIERLIASASSSSTSASSSSSVLVLVEPKFGKGKSALCEVRWRPIAGSTGEVYFHWREEKFVWHADDATFVKQRYPTVLSFGDYAQATGYSSQQELDEAIQRYGFNRFTIPIPTFMELYKEHAMAPFFVFQVFCVGLWCLDEYWYYALFTLFMLLVFEATCVTSRLRNLASLRTMVQAPRDIMVYRLGKWASVPSSELVPGDLVSIQRKKGGDAKIPAPCDVLLLKGEAVINEAMLTGESTPMMKESIASREPHEQLNLASDRVHVVYGGTSIISHSPRGDEASAAASSSSGTAKASKAHHQVPAAPDGGCLAYVLRTGFGTGQGKLMRTILFSTERVTANSAEAFGFIGFLLCFALAASAYVLNEGLKDPDRSRYKLALECILIITSVVPPELPMELSLAVNNSLIALAALGVFCTEPFRIPFAGKVDVCCFDKTGTLTSDQLILKGIAGLSTEVQDLVAPAEIPETAAHVVAGCHALTHVDDKIAGDPMEVAALKAIGWSLSKEGNARGSRADSYRVKVVHRYFFSSLLKRMSTIIKLDNPRGNTLYAVVSKGAPEVLKHHMSPKHIPANYDTVYKYYSRTGARVIALAYKSFDPTGIDIATLHREHVERDLEFAGFLIFDCPIKEESFAAIKNLRDASHMNIMITGDNTLTACKVWQRSHASSSQQSAHSVSQPSADADEPDITPEWVSIDEAVRAPLSQPVKQLAKEHDICLSGAALDYLVSAGLYQSVLPHATVYARVSPAQKELVISSLNRIGRTTLMCGDGTNDVGALKQAHIGVALLNRPFKRPPTTKRDAGMPPLLGSGTAASGTAPAKIAGSRSNVKQRPVGAKALSKQAIDARAHQTAATAQEQQKKRFGPPSIMDDEDGPLVQLGDASIASPFTAKSMSIAPIIDIIRQGRCTLVTTLQMFMILALNCLITAYSLSVLYLEGIKMGDTQATISGMLIAMCFFFISRSKPLPNLSSVRPSTSVFTFRFFASLLGQFAIHMASLMYVHATAKELEPLTGAVDLEKAFEPSLVNSAVYLISINMQISTFAINYQGHPFMQSLSENRPLRNCLLLVAGFTYMAAIQIIPGVNYMLEIVDFSPAFQGIMLLVMLADFGGAFLWQRTITRIFGP